MEDKLYELGQKVNEYESELAIQKSKFQQETLVLKEKVVTLQDQVLNWKEKCEKLKEANSKNSPDILLSLETENQELKEKLQEFEKSNQAAHIKSENVVNFVDFNLKILPDPALNLSKFIASTLDQEFNKDLGEEDTHIREIASRKLISYCIIKQWKLFKPENFTGHPEDYTDMNSCKWDFENHMQLRALSDYYKIDIILIKFSPNGMASNSLSNGQKYNKRIYLYLDCREKQSNVYEIMIGKEANNQETESWIFSTADMNARDKSMLLALRK